MDRRGFIGALAALAASVPQASRAELSPVIARRLALRDRVISLAEGRSKAAYAPPRTDVPKELAYLGYSAYLSIESAHDADIWRGDAGGFEVEPLLSGFIYHQRINLNLVEDGEIRSVQWDPAFFQFKGRTAPPKDADVGYSGARILTRMGSPALAREFLVFQGASYFRSRTAGLDYGLSARGIALRTGDPKGEEFPVFTDFWIEHPQPGAEEIVIHALLDGPSVTGAYMFTVRPGRTAGSQTRLGVNAVLFPRVDLNDVGLAPLTSMYWYGPLERGAVDNYRPQVHDSDGLIYCSQDGEWAWRPLANPKSLQMSSFLAGDLPLGYGLAQRARDWNDYEDLEAGYERRPGAWVAPHTDWPPGTVQLIEIPTANEYDDNIVAFWRPSAVLKAGSRLDFGYDLVFEAEIASGVGLLKVERSMSGTWGGMRQIVVDYATNGRSIEPHRLTPNVEATGGKIKAANLATIKETGDLRLTILLAPEADTAEIRAILEENERAVSETWLYRWTK